MKPGAWSPPAEIRCRTWCIYRYYGSTKGQTRANCEGHDSTIAALASKTANRCEILLGSVAKKPTKVTLILKGLPTNSPKIQVHLVPASDLDAPLTAETIPLMTDYIIEGEQGDVRVTLGRVEENQAYHLHLSK